MACHSTFTHGSALLPARGRERTSIPLSDARASRAALAMRVTVLMQPPAPDGGRLLSSTIVVTLIHSIGTLRRDISAAGRERARRLLGVVEVPVPIRIDDA